MKVETMHKMRLQAQQANRQLSKKSPLAREIEIYRDKMIREVLQNVPQLIKQQLAIANLPVSPDGPDNDTILKSTNSLLDRTFGKAKESIDMSGDVKFSLRALSEKSDVLEIENTPIDDNEEEFVEK